MLHKNDKSPDIKMEASEATAGVVYLLRLETSARTVNTDGCTLAARMATVTPRIVTEIPASASAAINLTVEWQKEDEGKPRQDAEDQKQYKH